jgi:hypothetical protein
MSRQNKVNPGMYTQRGRLTQDDAARELRKQSAFASPHTWQPVNRRLRAAPAGDAARGAEGTADAETDRPTRPPATASRASRATRTTRAIKATSKAKATVSTSRTTKAKTGGAKRRSVRLQADQPKTGRAKTSAVKRTVTTRRKK